MATPVIINLPNVLFLGSQLIECLENGVSQWPKLEGRFPQVRLIWIKNVSFPGNNNIIFSLFLERAFLFLISTLRNNSDMFQSSLKKNKYLFFLGSLIYFRLKFNNHNSYDGDFLLDCWTSYLRETAGTFFNLLWKRFWIIFKFAGSLKEPPISEEGKNDT